MKTKAFVVFLLMTASTADDRARGPNPWADVTTLGVRPLVSLSITPATPGLTASINATSTRATVSATNCGANGTCFVNGDHVVIYKAGPSPAISTPNQPKVAPDISTSSTGTMLGFVTAGAPGSARYSYQVVAVDTKGGLTAASSAGSTSTGAAALGYNTVSISQMSRSGSNGNTVTVTTSAAHGLSVGAAVDIYGSSDDAEFGGWVRVTSVPDTHHFTYNNGVSSLLGGGVSATSGTAGWYACNHISWTPVPGAWQYYIYGRTSGSIALIGVSLPQDAYNTNPTWDDYGPTMMQGLNVPPYVPSSPPSSAQPEYLSTQIVSGGGTTTLTFANAASNSVTSSTIRLDHGPSIVAAQKAASNSNLYFPSGGFVVNSLTNFAAARVAPSFLQIGTIQLNETVVLPSGMKWKGDFIPSTGSSPQFSFQGNTAVGVNTAYPGVYIPVGNGQVFSGVYFQPASNIYLGILIEDGNQVNFDNVAFTSIGNSTDYMGIGLFMSSFTKSDGSAFGIHMKKTLFASSQSNFSATPMFVCDQCGTNFMLETQFSGRSIFMGNQKFGGSFLEADWMYVQGGVQPLIMDSPESGAIAPATFNLKHVVLDTTGNPMLSYLGSDSGGPFITLEGPFIGPANGQPVYSGTPASHIFVFGDAFMTGQNMNVTTLANTYFSTFGLPNRAGNINVPYGGIQVGGVIGMGYALPRPAAPTVTVGAHRSCSTNCLPSGTYYYGISANDSNRGYSKVSPPASATVDGTQSVTVSWTLVNGQITTNHCRGTTLANVLCDHALGNGAEGTNYTDSNAISYSASLPALTTGFSEGLSAQGFAGHQAILVDRNSGYAVTAKPTKLSALRTLTTPDGNSASVLVASLTTTAATSDNVTIQGMTSSGHCILTPTNASAATNFSTTYISAKTANQITVTHTGTAGMTYDIVCTGI